MGHLRTLKNTLCKRNYVGHGGPKSDLSYGYVRGEIVGTKPLAEIIDFYISISHPTWLHSVAKASLRPRQLQIVAIRANSMKAKWHNFSTKAET